MRRTDFDEIAFFRAIRDCGARALLIGPRVLVLLGLPVLTADYNFWIGIDDIPRFNAAVGPFGLQPNRSPDEAQRTGRYVLENDEQADLLPSEGPRRHSPAADPRGGGTLVTSSTAAQVKALSERTLSADEARAWTDTPIGDDERAQVLALVRWFTRRYPTPADRLAYARMAYARWRRWTTPI